MSILKIARMGHPVLRGIAQPVTDPNAADIQQLIADMAETLADIGGAGLAAPQVHRPLRLVMFKVARERLTTLDGDVPQDFTVLINPVILPLGPEQDPGWEGCLSVPGLRGVVPRFRRIRYSGLDATGQPISRDVAGFHARVVQHECDHLDGVLYPERMTDLKLLSFLEEGMRYPVTLPGAVPSASTSSVSA